LARFDNFNVYVCVFVSATLVINISETKLFRGSCPIGSILESAYGASIGDVIDDVS